MMDTYEWRIAYTQKQLGGIAAGTYYFPCRSLDQALDVYGHYMALPHITGVKIERRPLAEWVAVSLDALVAEKEARPICDA